MNGSELIRSTKAALGAAVVLWTLFFLAAVVHTLVSGHKVSELEVAAWMFAIYAGVFGAALLLSLGPILQFGYVRRMGAAVSLPMAALPSFATLLFISLYFRDGGDPSTIGAVLAYWGREPLSLLVAGMPFLVASAAFVWFRGRAERL